jgi:ATP-binding cassette, subfamily F, member 3
VATPLIAADRLGKAYGGRTLFDEATFEVHHGDRVALVGPNGAGKSTLLRILAGRERPDHGTFQLQDVPVHWFDQHPVIPPGAKVRDLLAADRPLPPALAQEKAELEARIADPALYESPGYEAVLERYAAVEREASLSKQPPPVALQTLADLGFTEDDLDQGAASLSGGEKTRLFLGRTLMAARPGDLIVLDEPTNHLDIDSIEWLEDWIDAHEGTVLVVAHDRAFLDNVATRVFEVARGHITPFAGNYEDYVQARKEEDERAARDRAKAEERMQAVKSTIMQFRHQKRFDGQYASRMKALEKYEAALDHTPDPVLEKLGFGLGFESVQKSSDEMIDLRGVTKAYDGHLVLKGAELEIKKGERVALVGGNGSGKSTFLKILTGQLPKDDGKIRVAPGVKGTYFGQEHDDLEPERTLHEEVLTLRPAMEERDVKALLGRFRFDPEIDRKRQVKTLSGGERQRMMLLKSILRPSNLLILDEPTNHLDLVARDIVIQALNSYHGTLLLVSHDRFLLDSVTKKTAVLDQGQIHVYPGSFTATRHLHRRETPTVLKTRRYRVKKKFTDWSSEMRYRVDDEVDLSDDQIEESRALRNALAQGWLQRIG